MKNALFVMFVIYIAFAAGMIAGISCINEDIALNFNVQVLNDSFTYMFCTDLVLVAISFGGYIYLSEKEC